VNCPTDSCAGNLWLHVDGWKCDTCDHHDDLSAADWLADRVNEVGLPAGRVRRQHGASSLARPAGTHPTKDEAA
jgi:hypothetical protein